MSTFSNKHIPGDPFTPNPSDWKHADTAKHYAEEAGLYATHAKNYSDQLENNVTVLNEHIAELDEHASEIMRTVDESMDAIQSAVESSAESAEAAAASAEEAADIVSGVQDYVDRAEAAATGSESARDSAQAATTLAISAKDAASVYATDAQGYASDAQDAATDSAASATTASDAATSAHGYATSASTSSATSAQFAADSHGYANAASDSADSAGTYAQMAASSSASAAASATSASEAVERVVEVIPAFVGTMQEWDDLPQEEKDKCDGKIVRITDDNISNVCSTIQECEDSESNYNVAGASALVNYKSEQVYNGFLQGKNLYTGYEVENMYIPDNGIPTSANLNYYCANIRVKPSTDYVYSSQFSGSEAAQNFRIHEYDANGNWLRMKVKELHSTDFAIHFVTSADCYYIAVTRTAYNTQMQIEEGTQKTQYEAPIGLSNSAITKELAQVIDVNGINKADVVGSYTAKIYGKQLYITLRFTPSATGQVLLSNLPTILITSFYVPAHNYNNGAPVSGGVWVNSNDLVYYGTTGTNVTAYLNLLLK